MPIATGESDSRAADALEVVESREHVTRSRPVGRPEHARDLKLVDDARRTTVADFQPSLKERRRPLLVLNYNLRRFSEKFVTIALSLLFSIPATLRSLRFTL